MCWRHASLLRSLNKHLLTVEELEPKLMDLRSAGSAGITASTKTLSITVRRSKEGNWPYRCVQMAAAEGGLGIWVNSNVMELGNINVIWIRQYNSCKDGTVSKGSSVLYRDDWENTPWDEKRCAAWASIN